jgi:membrane fusion protein (multidrug efflux system)
LQDITKMASPKGGFYQYFMVIVLLVTILLLQTSLPLLAFFTMNTRVLHTTRLTSLLLASCCIATSCSHKKEEAAKPAGKPNTLAAEVYVVHPQSFDTRYTTNGTLLPNEEVNILSEVAGRVTSIRFKEGTAVQKGQVLVTLYNEDIKAQIEKSRSLRQLQVSIRNRQGELLRIGGISQQDYESTATQIKSIDADIAYAEAQLRRTTILAPFSGLIGIRNISEGAVVTPSTVIATLQQVSTLKMDFTIPDQYKAEIYTGKKVFFSLTGSLDTFSAVVNATDAGANAITHTLTVRAIVNNASQKLLAGSFTHVLIPFDHTNNAILIPPQSVIPTTRDKKVALVSNGKAKLVTVMLGTRTNEMVEIVQGLSAGDTILTTGIMQVKGGMNVKVKGIYSLATADSVAEQSQ